jgi:polar amino acid transport system substrate-binding protein
VRLPSERALASLDRGEIDGDYVRIAGLEQTYPNLIRVDEPVAHMDFGAFTKSKALRFSRWEDLRSRRIGAIIGWKIIEQRTKGFDSVSAVRDENALFGLLLADRVDAVVYDLLEGGRYIKRGGFSEAIFPGPTLERRDMYLYLNKKNADLAGKLAAALRSMRTEGLIDKLTAETLAMVGP